MSNEELNRMSEEVREEGLNQGSSMKDLVFDPVTGDFRQVERGSHRGEGDVVTEMTNKGFAAEGTSLEVYLCEDDLNQICQKLLTENKEEGFAELLDGDVFHVHLNIKKTRYSTDLIPVIFTKDERLTLRHEGDDVLYIIVNETRVIAYLVSGKKRNPVKVNYIPSQENIFSRMR